MYWVKCEYFAQSSKSGLESAATLHLASPSATKAPPVLYQQSGGNPANRPCGECIHGIYHPHLSLKSISTIPPTSSQCPHISKGVSFTYSLGAFPDLCFFAGSWGETISNPFKREICFLIALQNSLDDNPLVFQARCSLGLFLWCRSQEWGV